jgi:folate-dependent phosphoribosylglycinamide formyltransferase PurN
MRQIIEFATGDREKGGGGFARDVAYFRAKETAVIAGVVSNIKDGSVARRARELDVPFMHLPGDMCTREGYASVAPHFNVDDPWYVCNGWLRHVIGLSPARTINSHPARLSQMNGRFGGRNMYKRLAHEAVKEALEKGELDVEVEHGRTTKLVSYTGWTMHFVISEGNKESDYDRGPIFAEIPIPIEKGMSVEAIEERVKCVANTYRSILTEMVVLEQIRLVDGEVKVPFGYGLLPRIKDPRFP